MRMLSVVAVLLLLYAPIAPAAEINGPCRNGYQWSADGDGGAIVVFYNECSPSGDFFAMTCRAGRVRMSFEVPIAGLEEGQSVVGGFTIDGRSFEVGGRTIYSEMLNGTVVRMQTRSDDPVLGAMDRGQRMTLQLGSESFRFHLSGSRRVIQEMLIACR